MKFENDADYLDEAQSHCGIFRQNSAEMIDWTSNK